MWCKQNFVLTEQYWNNALENWLFLKVYKKFRTFLVNSHQIIINSDRFTMGNCPTWLRLVLSWNRSNNIVIYIRFTFHNLIAIELHKLLWCFLFEYVIEVQLLLNRIYGDFDRLDLLLPDTLTQVLNTHTFRRFIDFILDIYRFEIHPDRLFRFISPCVHQRYYIWQDIYRSVGFTNWPEYTFGQTNSKNWRIKNGLFV